LLHLRDDRLGAVERRRRRISVELWRHLVARRLRAVAGLGLGTFSGSARCAA
jgi:hypothetical protein